MSLRTHQCNCINKIDEHFKVDNIGLVKMFCGSGKSFIIYHCLLKYGDNLSVVVVPSINLITQFNRDYLLDKSKKEYNNKYFEKEYELLTVCSKNELDKKLQKEFSFTTDEDKILEFLKKKEDKIVLITYQSLKTLFDVVKENELEINLICFDEAHHILGDGMKELLFGTDEDDMENFNENFIDTYVKKALYFTATPKNSNGIKMYEPTIDITINDQNYEILDDEDTYYQEELHCGKLIFEYIHIDGVNDDILNDFNIRVDLYTENKDNSIFEAISRSILETANNRVLTFHSRSETKSKKGSDVLSFINKENFIKCFNKVIENEFPKLKNKYKNIEFKGMTTNTKDKIKILNEFDKTKDNDIFILSSCKTISEGIDTKNANMVVFIDPKQSYVDIIQNIGRVCRKQDKLSTILIPTYVDVAKYKDCITKEDKDKIIRNEMSKTGDFNTILNVLSALRQEDPYMFELCLKYSDKYTEKEMTNNLKRHSLECEKKEYTNEELFEEYKLKYNSTKSEEDNFKVLSEKINKNIQIINNKVLENDIYINNEQKEILYVVKKDNNIYVKTKGNCNNKIQKCNRNIKPFVHANDEIKILWEIDNDIGLDKKIFGGYIKSVVISQNEKNWMEMLDEAKKYIDENKKKPTHYDKGDTKQMGKWLEHQQTNYNKKIYLMKNKNIRKEWENFLDKYKNLFLSNTEKWLCMLQKIKKYIDDYNKIPFRHDEIDDNKIMGRWIDKTKRDHDLKINVMKNNEIYNKWTEFVSNVKYKNLFIDDKSKWMVKMEEIKQYIDKNNKLPSRETDDEKQLAYWLDRQKKLFKNKDRIMKNEEIKMQWKKFTNDDKYTKYFMSVEDEWFLNLKQIKEFIDLHDKRPNNHGDKDEQKLGSWITTQKSNYKENKFIMKNEQMKNAWLEFINDEKYGKYIMGESDIWLNNLKMLEDFIEQYHETPSQNIKKEEYFARWLSLQKRNYKNKKGIVTTDDLADKWIKFTEKYEKYLTDNNEKWTDILDEAKQYFIKNNKRPNNHDKYDEYSRKLGNWLISNTSKYKNKKGIMNQQEYRKLWEDFITEYQQYFPDNPAIQKYIIKQDEIIEDKPKKKITVEVRDGNEQQKFKNNLMKLYDGKCIITGSIKPLEGAHIIPYSECNNFKIDNGLLLKSDIHTLFDNFDISINPNTMKVELTEEMKNDEECKKYHNKKIIIDNKYIDDIKNNLKVHYAKFLEKHKDDDIDYLSGD
jgi:superfamily II DNA or RNA helicase